jgi:hypothetical protein
MDLKTVTKLKKKITEQLADLIRFELDNHTTAGNIAYEFKFDDGKEQGQHTKEQGQHTKEHGQGLTTKSVKYLLIWADDIFEEQINEKTDISYWRVRDSCADRPDAPANSRH